MPMPWTEGTADRTYETPKNGINAIFHQTSRPNPSKRNVSQRVTTQNYEKNRKTWKGLCGKS